MARWKFIENEIRNLVLCIGGQEIGEENIKLCIEFGLSNLKFHKFLDTNEKNVDKSIQGIRDKLMIHNLQSKADLLNEYYKLFLEGPLLKEDLRGYTSLHYSMLHLLLLTSNSPTEDKLQYSRLVRNDEKQNAYQKFDWGAYLKEGLNDGNDIDDGDNTDDDDDYFSDDEDHTNLNVLRDVTNGCDIPTCDDSDTLKSDTNKNIDYISNDRMDYITKGSIVFGMENIDIKDFIDGQDVMDVVDYRDHIQRVKTQERIAKSRKWLEDNIMPSYWLGNVDRSCSSTSQNLSRSSRLLSDWNDYLSSNSCIDLTRNQNLLTEYQVVREVLWLLSGFEGLYVFPWDGFKYNVNKNVVVSHLAESSLHHLLEELTSYGSMVKSLNEYVEAISHKALTRPLQVDPEVEGGEGDLGLLFSLSTVTQSHQAFASAVSLQMKGITAKILEFIDIVMKQEDIVTLTSLMLSLEPQFKLLSILFYFLVEGVIRPLSSSASSSPTPPSSSSSFIQILISRYLESTDKITSGKVSQRFSRLSSSCTVKSSSQSSQLSSPSKLTSQLLNTIYGCLMTMDRTSYFDDDEVNLILQMWMDTCKPYLEMLDSWLKSGSFYDPWNEFFIRRSENWENLGERFWEDAVCLEDVENTSFVFLQPILKQIVVTGKSLRLLEGITNQRMTFQHHHHHDKMSLYQSYFESLANKLNNSSGGYNDDGRINGVDEELEQISQDVYIERFLRSFHPSLSADPMFVDVLRNKLKSSHPLLLCSFLELNESTSQTGRSPSLSPLSNHHGDGFLHLVLHDSLQSYVKQRYLATSRSLLDVIRNRCHLHHHLASIKKYFLMESGRMMFDFYTSFFKSMEDKVEWWEEDYLKFLLCEGFDESSEELSRITMVVNDTNEPTNSIHFLESIIMDYKIPWPCNMVINSKCMKVYNEIFQFLLQIKWAKYSLDSLKFSDLQDRTMKHRISIFKMKVLHFVNSFHNYIMTRILHSISLEFQLRFDSVLDFDELIYIHSAYLETIYDRCLLHQKVFLIRKMVLKVLQMALDINGIWKAYAIQEEHLHEMEKEFNRCIQFLSSLVNQVIARGSLAHLELLAFTFHSCLNSTK